MKLTDEEYNKLEGAHSQDEYNQYIDEIRAARGGAYPSDWFQRVLSANLLGFKKQEWSSNR